MPRLKTAMERYNGDIRVLLRKEKLRYTKVAQEGETVRVTFKDAAKRDQAYDVIGNDQRFGDLVLDTKEEGDNFLVIAKLRQTALLSVKRFALQQNITTLRNRVNAMGVAEPIIQQQGERRIVVQLPGAQDSRRDQEDPQCNCHSRISCRGYRT